MKNNLFLVVLLWMTLTGLLLAGSEGKDTDPNETSTEKSPSTQFYDQFKTNGRPTGDLIRHFTLAILLVGILGGAAFYLSKHLGNRLVRAKGQHIKIIESLSLGMKKQLHLIEVDSGRKILIASTSDRITFLTELFEMSKDKTAEFKEVDKSC